MRKRPKCPIYGPETFVPGGRPPLREELQLLDSIQRAHYLLPPKSYRRTAYAKYIAEPLGRYAKHSMEGYSILLRPQQFSIFLRYCSRAMDYIQHFEY